MGETAAAVDLCAAFRGQLLHRNHTLEPDLQLEKSGVMASSTAKLGIGTRLSAKDRTGIGAGASRSPGDRRQLHPPREPKLAEGPGMGVKASLLSDRNCSRFFLSSPSPRAEAGFGTHIYI